MMAYFEEDIKDFQNLYNTMFNDYFNNLIKESARTEVLENTKEYTKEYTKDEIENLLDIADDIDGCLLPDCQPKTELIQRKIS